MKQAWCQIKNDMMFDIFKQLYLKDNEIQSNKQLPGEVFE